MKAGHYLVIIALVFYLIGRTVKILHWVFLNFITGSHLMNIAYIIFFIAVIVLFIEAKKKN
ncbi:hypothetical protein CLV91_2171 [Maribacter vaceletii]|uniref:Uncharacterized protein n=1 Tax=Maribacter vaceletii TaxID=1206816 RepID=A0A495E958_9FLAO|nr:hypothetical protein CLV91_2171 [Maribacter vaceletii]